MFFNHQFHNIFCLNLLLFIPFLTLADTLEDAFVVIFMTKNDENTICQKLDPYVYEGQQSFLIYDCYSTDNTIQVIENYFTKHRISRYNIIQAPFKGTMVKSLNYALELAEQYFPEATFLFIPWLENLLLHNISKLQQFCREQKNASAKCYKILQNSFDKTGKRIAFAHQPILIRAHTQTRFSPLYPGAGYFPIIDTKDKAPSDIFCTFI